MNFAMTCLFAILFSFLTFFSRISDAETIPELLMVIGSMTQGPSGNIDLLPAPGDVFWNNFAANPSLGKAWIDGFRGRSNWGVIQASSVAQYDWSGIDSVVAACTAAGKFLTISIRFGVGSPAWLAADPNVAMIGVDTNEDGTDDGTMPLPFDPDYQAYLRTFINAMGARYDGNPTVRAIFFGGHGPFSGENYVVTTDPDIAAFDAAAVAAGYADKSAAYRAAVDAIFPMWKTAFPRTALIFGSSNPWGGRGGTDAVDKTYAENAAIALGAGVATSQLHATSTHTGVPDLKPYVHGEQAISSSKDQTRFYLPPIPDPYPTPPQPVLDMGLNAYDRGDQYVEWYESDLRDSANDATLTTLRLQFISNLP